MNKLAIVTVVTTLNTLWASTSLSQELRECITTLDVHGYQNVFDPYAHPQMPYLYLVYAAIRDDGESEANFVSPTADIGLHIYGGDNFGEKLNAVRLFGPYDEGVDNLGPKLEWDDNCTVVYNNFALIPVDFSYRGVLIQAIEGDDFPGNPDDVVFNAYVWFNEVWQGTNKIITGNCDIPGMCATFVFEIRDCESSPNCGYFWDPTVPSSVPPLPRSVPKPLVKGAELFIRGAETIKWIVKKGLGFPSIWPHNWVVIEYADGYCIFNRFRGNRTGDDVLAHARGEGDCQWWEWPESAQRYVCLDSYPAAAELSQAHGRISNIQWIDHPTQNCGH